MSCFVVPDYHVSALVAWAIRQGVTLDASPDAVAHMLASANRCAYSDRYAGRYDAELAPFGGLDRSAGADLAPVAIVKACDCLDYQASDWSRWDDSDAFGYMVAIRRAAVALADPDGRATSGRALPGYDAAPWCLDPPSVTSCPHCGRDLETPDELAGGLCTSDDCPRHDSTADRLAAALANMSERDLAVIRAALAARCAA
jgi:hypothetical protein